MQFLRVVSNGDIVYSMNNINGQRGEFVILFKRNNSFPRVVVKSLARRLKDDLWSK
jgi:hypothetical protein